MRGVILGVSLAAGVTIRATQPAASATLAIVLQRAGEQVERYFTRAQSLVCLEVAQLQPFTAGWSSDGLGRTVESELRLSWQPAADGAPSTEAQTLRKLLRVNGRQPRAKDSDNCTTPEQQTKEPHSLSLLLPAQRVDYRFTMAGDSRIDRRTAFVVDYVPVKPVSVKTRMVEGKDDCVSFDVEGGMRGRIWIDQDTFDVLRLDQRLSGMVEIPLPRTLRQRAGSPLSWTLERMDTSMRFKPVSFTNPDETLVLPVSSISVTIARGAGTPRLRTTTDYRKYQRFLTGTRVVGE